MKKTHKYLKGNTSEAGFNASEVPFEDAWKFIKKVGIAAHNYGATATRLESFLVGLSKSFGYQGVFRSNPSGIVFAIWESPELPQRVEMIDTATPDLNLDKLAQLGDLLNAYNTGKISLTETSTRIDKIEEAPLPWGKFVTLLSYAFVGVGLAPLLGGGWLDTFFAMLFSMLVYGIVLLSGRLGKVAIEWMPFTTAFVVGLLVTVLKFWIPELNIVLITLSAVAIILPGYTISLGAGELVSKHVVSGTANLMSGLTCLVKQIGGGWFGIAIANLLVTISTVEPAVPVNKLWLLLLFPLLLIGLSLAFQTSKRDLPWAVLVSGIAYLGVLAGGSILDTNVGNLLGTVIAVVISNLWSKYTGRPTSIVLIPAIILLVSGTIGFRGLASMAQGDLLLGIQQFFQMFVVAVTIVVGILIGYTIIRPEPKL